MTSATLAGEAAARSAGVGQRRKSSGVTRLTCASVVWADSSTEITRWNGFSWSRKHSTGPYFWSRRRHTSTARADFAALVSRGMALSLPSERRRREGRLPPVGLNGESLQIAAMIYSTAPMTHRKEPHDP